jgi:leucyl/phenylalanyl-tRNA---protein transferase
MLRIAQLRRSDPFPPLERANDEVGGLLAYGADLSAERLLDAYSRGIFPWYSHGDPILWWSPDPRMVLEVERFHVSRSLARRRRSAGLEIRVNTAFAQVIAACSATPRDGQDGTWITAEMIAAYTRLHALGFAHSVETWRDGALVGGLYGIAIDRMFFGESMFAHESDASKIALAHLVDMLRVAGMPRIDCQQQTAHLASLGARPEPRVAFAAQLRVLIREIKPWPVDARASAS